MRISSAFIRDILGLYTIGVSVLGDILKILHDVKHLRPRELWKYGTLGNAGFGVSAVRII